MFSVAANPTEFTIPSGGSQDVTYTFTDARRVPQITSITLPPGGTSTVVSVTITQAVIRYGGTMTGQITVTFQSGRQTASAVVTVSAASIYDRTVTGSQPAGFTVPAGQTWRVQGLVETPANVIVEGTLILRAGDTLRFVNVDESAFVGSGNVVLASDVGLWVIGSGILDVQGTPKVPWNRTGTDPSWKPTDELVITPTAAGDFACSPYVSGSPIPQAFPDVPPAEVINLTRDCAIEGTPTGKAHIFIISTEPQNMAYVGVRYMGPRKNDDVIVGRWPIHLHHGGEGSRGTIIEGVVVRDAGSHAYVAHDSNGVTFLDCVAYDVQTDPYWWDKDEPTADAVYDGCIAANVSVGEPDGTVRGFSMHPQAPGGIARNCVAAGIAGSDARGFGWSVGSTSDHWIFEDNLAHNCQEAGIRWWANQILTGTPPTRTDRFTAYNCGQGVFQGAYSNGVRHDDLKLRGGELEWHASAKTTSPAGQRAGADRADINVVGRKPYALHLTGSNIPSPEPGIFTDCKFDGATGQAIQIEVNDRQRAWDFIRCTVNGADLEFVNFQRANPGGHVQDYEVRVQRRNGSAFRFGPTGSATPIPPFA